VIQLVLPPRRIDLLTDVSGLLLGEAWRERIDVRTDRVAVPFLGRSTLIRTKRANARLECRNCQYLQPEPLPEVLHAT
jgi:hypothetical protein